MGMTSGLTEAEIAQRAGTTLERVRELVDSESSDRALGGTVS